MVHKSPGKLRFGAEQVSKMQQGYEERIARQVEIINRLKEEVASAKADAAEGKGARLIATVLLKRLEGDVVIHRKDLEEAESTEVTVIEREGGGVVVRVEK